MGGTILKTSRDFFFFPVLGKTAGDRKKKKKFNCVVVKQAFFQVAKLPHSTMEIYDSLIMCDFLYIFS